MTWVSFKSYERKHSSFPLLCQAKFEGSFFLVIAIEVRNHCKVFTEIAKILSGLFGDEDDSISRRTAEIGLFSIIQLCAHVESICGERFGSGSIRFGVYARVNARSTKNRDLELETGNHIYTIWGPKLDNERDRGCERLVVEMKDPRSTFPIAQTEGVASEGTSCTTDAMDAVYNREGANAIRTTSVFCHSDAHIQRLDVRECFHRGLRSRNGRKTSHTFMQWMCASKIPKFCNFWSQTSVGTNDVQAFYSKF